MKFFDDWGLTTSWGVVTDIGGEAMASVFAFNNLVASGVAMVAPLLYGWTARDFGWMPVFVIVGVIYLLCAASWLLVNCTIPLLA